MVSGLAPGSAAETWMVGKSTCGRGATGRNGYAAIPASRSPAIRSAVAIGRRMNGDDTFMSRDSLNLGPILGAIRHLGIDGGTRLNLEVPGHHHPFALIDAAGDHRQCL